MIQEVTETLGNYYGFVPPLLDAAIGAPNEELQKTFFQLLGLTDAHADTKDYTKSTHYFAAVAFLEAHAKQIVPLAGTWDLRDDVVSPLKYSTRLKYLEIHEIQTVDDSGKVNVSQLFCFDIPSTTILWKLAVVHPADALLVCRLPPNMAEDDIAFFLLQRGIAFKTLIPRQHVIPRFYRTPPIHPLPTRTLDHVFIRTDYDSYLNTRTLLLGQPHMQAALRRGGIIWRLAISTLGLSEAFWVATQCGITTVIKFGEHEYVEDELATFELDLLCGAYVCVDEQSGCRALKSWWPLSRFYETPKNGENYGHWCNRRERWYLARVEHIEKRGQPLTYSGWKSNQRGDNTIRKFHTSVQKASLNFIRQNISSVRL